MANKLFVGGLSWNTTDDGLRQAFEAYGEVTDAVVIKDRETGRSRGFGFVTFSSGDAASSAITALDGSSLDGRSIRVNEAKERSGGGGSGFRPGGGGGGGYRSRDGGGRDGGGRDGGGRDRGDRGDRGGRDRGGPRW